MNVVRLALVLATGGTFTVAAPGTSQTTDSAAKSHAPAASDQRDTLFLRARRLVAEGNGAAGRALVDSALAATAAGTTEYATALYWRGALSSTAADAERDYRRIIVEYPFSPHSGDALLALAQLEMARGDRDPAIDHLQRFLLQRPNDPDRVRAGVWLGRLLLEANQLLKGCAVLLRTRASLGVTAVEARNQVDYYANRCAGVDTTQQAPRPVRVQTPSARTQPADSATPARRAPNKETPRIDTARRAPVRRDSVRRDSVRRDTIRRDTPRSTGRFTVQVAAYDTRQAAEQLVTKLGARGISARVVESKTAPFRVRVGHYPSDSAAAVAARDLKAKGI